LVFGSRAHQKFTDFIKETRSKFNTKESRDAYEAAMKELRDEISKYIARGFNEER
jgi:IS1 family transposase